MKEIEERQAIKPTERNYRSTFKMVSLFASAALVATGCAQNMAVEVEEEEGFGSDENTTTEGTIEEETTEGEITEEEWEEGNEEDLCYDEDEDGYCDDGDGRVGGTYIMKNGKKIYKKITGKSSSFSNGGIGRSSSYSGSGGG
ncbi:hypothetical protein [Mechercharimyces sp. CAU 1602]|uniref:hypothetical protein n=1 Tax=Mechercharimyces sp. CAU 1602 TaxID=2973933 RepID=UPI00216290B2|nr:hypothetical protein [Mechercharimyces sp. CAU 1602]MCS1350211.1 hypothetical protein [Mechercharimyces sp. CAU 1602]